MFPGGVKELNATYEMLVAFKSAIRNNEHWSGSEVEAVAMGLNMVAMMESQYRGQLERAREMEKEALKQAKEQIKALGGKANGTN